MDNRFTDIEQEIFSVTDASFTKLALEVFSLQYQHNAVYRSFCTSLKRGPEQVKQLHQIPFLPIQFFKSHEVKTTSFEPEQVFESSGTTGTVNSRHFVKKTSLYKRSFETTFELFYTHPGNICVIGLLPSYLERGSSSLVYMVNELVAQSDYGESGFYLYNYGQLRQTLTTNEAGSIPTLLIGVTYALLDFAEKFPMPLKHTIVMETGGMKGRREELTRDEVHTLLKKQFQLEKIHSEYGMTELLSQAYAPVAGRFQCPPWMKVLLRAEDDPFHIVIVEAETLKPTTGVINVVDLANLYSCSFIATDDIGKQFHDYSFEVMGRLDNSDLRGCGLMIL